MGLDEIKKLLPDEAFAGRGVQTGPEIIMTDDDSVSIVKFSVENLILARFIYNF